MKYVNNYKRWLLAFATLAISITVDSQELIIDSLPYKSSYKKIRILLPENYEKSLANRELIFMTDAQNLFDKKTSFSGEWEVDEAIDRLKVPLKPIVVGIDHGNSERINELTPFANDKYGGGQADYFLKWITEDLFKYLKIKFTIIPKRKLTSISGSSLGGLFAHYAIVKRSDIFSKAGILSPSYWFSKENYEFTSSNTIDFPIQVFISAGNQESQDLLTEIDKMKNILETKIQVEEIKPLVIEGQHNEKNWKQVFPKFLDFLYK